MTVQELAELIKESATVVGGALAVGGVVALFVIDAIVARRVSPLSERVTAVEAKGEDHGERIGRVEAQVDDLRRAA